jgi:hypothetical protein
VSGQWEDGKKHGKGTMSYANGEKYTGDWLNDVREGEGIYTFANGDRYE